METPDDEGPDPDINNPLPPEPAALAPELQTHAAGILRAHVITIKEVISICGTLISTQMPDGSQTEEMDGGVIDAAQTTLINAFDRLDSLLKNNKNWIIS